MKILILAVLLGLVIGWYSQDIYVQPGRAEVASPAITAAIKHMGPGYNYRLLNDKTLQVKLDGQWQKLQY